MKDTDRDGMAKGGKVKCATGGKVKKPAPYAKGGTVKLKTGGLTARDIGCAKRGGNYKGMS